MRLTTLCGPEAFKGCEARKFVPEPQFTIRSLRQKAFTETDQRGFYRRPAQRLVNQVLGN